MGMPSFAISQISSYESMAAMCAAMLRAESPEIVKRGQDALELFGRQDDDRFKEIGLAYLAEAESNNYVMEALNQYLRRHGWSFEFARDQEGNLALLGRP